MTTEEVWKFAPAYELPSWPFVVPPDLAARERRRYPVVIAGAGLAGLTLACDLALRGIEVVVLDEDDTVGVRGASSRGICYAQKSLEIFDRLGIYERIRDKGITWSIGRTFSGADEIYSFNLKDESFSEQPPFINLQQFYLEWFLVERVRELAPEAIRWKSTVARVEHGSDGAVIEVETPAGAYALEADWFVDATGANSRIRDELGLEAHPSRHTDRWCISDVRFKTPFAVERWTWIDAPFNEGRGVWQHLMADAVWRLDYQMDEHADPESISRPEVAGARCASSSAPTSSSSSSGSARTSTATTCSTPSASAARSSSATPPTSSALSARAAATTASRTPPTWAGSSPSPCRGRRARRSSTATTTSATRRRSRTCA